MILEEPGSRVGGCRENSRRHTMTGRRRTAVLWLAPSVALALATSSGRAADAPGRCCLTNERFAGVCEVVPEPSATCADILAYLNNPNAAGKTYCGSTEIRGGWVQVRCADDAPPSSGRASTGSGAVAAPDRDDRRLVKPPR
jgi:hypothetical protein